MADIQAFIPALNGEEVIQDLCGAIAEKLRSDCNLRPIDGYSGGYKASVKIHIEMFGLDTATVDYPIEVDETSPDPQNVLGEPDDVIDTELEIPIEEDLSLVRERSNQPTPDFEAKPEFTEDGPIGQPKPRKYSRRLKMLATAGVAQGGSAPMSEE